MTSLDLALIGNSGVGALPTAPAASSGLACPASTATPCAARSCAHLRPWRLLGVGIASLCAVLGSPSPGRTADLGQESAPAAPISPVPLVVVEEGKLTVDVHHAELESVLREIATRAAFDLRTSGKLGRVTATFAGVSLEEGLRRLAPGRELMLVYRGSVGRADQALVEVRVFAGSPASDPRRAAADLAEINQLLRTGAGPEGIARLVDLLGAAPEPAVRSRAAAVLGWRGGMGSETALTEALNDPAPDVRAQVVDALRRVAGARAIPALVRLLLRDPDAVVRRAAARSLGMLPEAAATSALTAAAGDPDASVRKQVIWALRRRGVLDP